MLACCTSFWLGLSIFTACSKIRLVEGETVEVVDYSDLAIFDAFNNSYLKIFYDDFLYSGMIQK
jgi:hypothetical protein